jgi:ABC-type antimicrobial peptide transport system permease subunit
MLRNYLKIAFRNFTKNSLYSFINVTGLSIGLACSILILLWVADEQSFNQALPNKENIHQLYINATYDGEITSFNSVPLPSYQELKTTDSRIKNAAVSDWGSEYLIANGETRIRKSGMYASEEFLQIFQFTMLAGNGATALSDASSIVLTESTARALFGDADPMGQVVRIDNATDLKVSGILQDLPHNSSFSFEVLLPWKLNQQQEWVKENETEWGNYSFQVYVELHPTATENEVNEAIRDILTKKGQTDIKREFFLHPLVKWRLYTTFENGQASGGMIEYVQGFSFVALLIIVMACINFMNLATARSERRAREVGIRKSVGSRKSELVIQFLGESVLIVLFSFVLAIVITEVTLPLYNDLTSKKLFIDYASPVFWLVSVGTILITGVFAGSYPAFYLSSFLPAKVLKGKIQVGRSVTRPRQILVVLQFVFAVGLIVSTIVISQQIQFAQSRQLGYDQKNLISIWFNDEITKNYKAIKTDLLASGLIHSVTQSNSPVTEIFSNNFVDWPGKPEEEKVLFSTIATEYDYAKTLGAKIIEGRDFSPEFPSDSLAVLVNQAAVDIMGLDENIGTQITLWGDKRTIVGVIDNIVMRSPYEKPKPMIVGHLPGWANSMTIRLEPSEDLPGTIAQVESIFKKHAPTNPFQYTFVDVEFAKKFSTIKLIGNITNLFAFLSLFITSLGLFGLAAFTVEQRTKEIGIRKVLGATVSGIILLVSKEFSWLVLIAFAIAGPGSWWILSSFLERYEYRIEFPYWALAVAGITALLFALAIVSTQALRAAVANPSESLRSE